MTISQTEKTERTEQTLSETVDETLSNKLDIYGFDSETTLFEEFFSPILRLWAIYNKKSQVVGLDRDSFADYVQNIYNNMIMDTVFIAHNLSFDYYMLLIDRVIETHKLGTTFIRVFTSPSFAVYSKLINYYEHIETKKHVIKKPRIHKSMWKRKKKTIKLYFVDLSNYFLGFPRLDDVAKSFGVGQKMKIDLNTQNPQLLAEYCMQDAKLTHDVLKIILSYVDTSIGFKITASSLGFAELKRLSGWKTFKRHWEIRKKERLALFGGRTGFNKAYVGIEIKGYSYDIHSAYSSIQREMKVPIQFGGEMSLFKGDYSKHDMYDTVKEIFESDDRTALITGEIYLNKPVLPYKRVNKLGIEELTFDCFDENGDRVHRVGTWSILEFYPAWRDHEIEVVHVSHIAWYKCEKGMFAPFVDKYYNMKLESAKGSPSYSIAKLFLNGGAYGKFVERDRADIPLDKIEKYHNISLDELLQERIDNIGDKNYGYFDMICYCSKHIDCVIDWCKSKKCDHPKKPQLLKIRVEANDMYIRIVSDEETYGACTIVGVEITAGARRKFWEEGLRGNDTIRWDTDGVTLTHRMDDTYLHDWQLGKWALEPCKDCIYHQEHKELCDDRCEYEYVDSCTFLAMGKKDYRCRHEIKLKGVPKMNFEGEPVLNDDNYLKGYWDFKRLIKPLDSFRRSKQYAEPYSLVDMSKTRKY